MIPYDAIFPEAPRPMPEPEQPSVSEPAETELEEVWLDELYEQMEQHTEEAEIVLEVTEELMLSTASEISSYELGVAIGLLIGILLAVIWAVTFKV